MTPAPAGLLGYYTPKEVATLLRVSVKTVYRLAAQDVTLPCLRLGGKGGAVRFPQARLAAWLRAREQGAGRAPRTRKPLSDEPEVRDSTGAGEDGSGRMRHSVCQSEPALRVVRGRRAAP